MRNERIESDNAVEAFFSPFCHRFLLFFPPSYNSSKNTDTGWVSYNGQVTDVPMHLRHLVYGCNDFNGSCHGIDMNIWFQ